MPSTDVPGTDPAASGSPGSESSRGERSRAGGDLKRAGEQVAQAGENMGNAAGGQSGAQGDSATGETSSGSGEPDPLTKDAVGEEESGEITFADTGGPASAGGDGADGGMSDELEAEIQAAQEALIEAGITLQEAGDAVANAETEEELARARDLLADARVVLVVASQDLLEARDVWGDEYPEVFDQAEGALNDATVAVVVAGGAILDMPNLPQTADTRSTGRMGDLEDELETSLIIFDGEIIEARETVLNPGGQESDLPGGGTGGVMTTAGNSSTPGTGQATEAAEDGASTSSSGANSQGISDNAAPGEQMASADIPEDIGPGQDDDIVAQQLREAATAETDPELREKLWEEYRRYKAGL